LTAADDEGVDDVLGLDRDGVTLAGDGLGAAVFGRLTFLGV
jgi:hypothetical protein